jgi:CheY-like chemotaxis protein
VVLVVEDEETVREVAVEVLHRLGYQVLQAADAEAGLQVMRNGVAIDLLLSDIGLPRMSGRELADAARELRPQLPVLLMTGYAGAATSAAGFLAPGMALLTKPFSVDKLARRVSQMLTGTVSAAP